MLTFAQTSDRLALAAITAVRATFDTVTGYSHTKAMTADQYLLRIIL